MLIDFIYFILSYLFHRMILSDRPKNPGRDQAETQELQAGPYATCPRFGPFGLVALMQGQAELPRALVRRLTGARSGSSSGLPGCSNNSQLLLLGTTRSLGTLLAVCVSTIELCTM